MDELKRLAEFSSALKLENVPGRAVKAARLCVLDTVGSALGAAREEEIRSLVREIVQWTGKGRSSGGKTASVWGQECETNLFGALLLDGMMGHALELDDVHTKSKTHIGVVVVTAAWCLAEALEKDGRSFLQAVVAGYEVMSRVAMGVGVASHRRKGWHATGTMGAFGAAAAAANLLNLDAGQTLSAFGMAGTQASGLWAFLEEGSSCKKLHPARAAVNGVTAAILARASMTGPGHILDAADGGLYAAVSDASDLSLVDRGLGEVYEIEAMDKKLYPCCRSTHPAIDAALRIRSEYGVSAEDIESVLVETYQVGVLQCGFEQYPVNGVEAKFSTRFACAAAFVYGRVGREQFAPEALKNPAVRRIADATRVAEDPMFSGRYPGRWGCRMTVCLKSGAKLIKQIDDMSGSAADPLTEEQEREKFSFLSRSVLGSERAERLRESILTIDTLSALPDLA